MERETELLLMDIESYSGDLAVILPGMQYGRFIDLIDDMFLMGKRYGSIYVYATRKCHRLYLHLWFSSERLAYKSLYNDSGLTDNILIPDQEYNFLEFAKNMVAYTDRIRNFWETMRKYEPRMMGVVPPGFEEVNLDDLPDFDEDDLPEEWK